MRPEQRNKISYMRQIIRLLINGLIPGTVKYYQSLTPHSQLVIIKDAGHMTMQDKPEEHLKAISTFLSDLEKN